MVPGSTFIYGSAFKMLTLRPAFFKSVAILAEAIPLPSELKTPPVTKIYLVSFFADIFFLKFIILQLYLFNFYTW